ncbi:hypothetical protein Dsin_025590 [Dipteronia sinensis]|uniref:Nodulin-like domain-containing protein n=1 Tax=Dipteronia sinensis TaxID=43782 RepID=A0AAE0DWY6_9ROSI|nr:hypothetical protein Dsin_025590 [Dipteronia sinensis]
MGLESPPTKSSAASKWLGFVTAVWVQSISGNNYTFSNYSDALKTLMSLTQLQLNNLSVAKDVGKAFGLLAGISSDRLPTSVILLIGSIEGLIGYGAQWLVVSKRIQPLPYWQMCVFLCMGGNSTTWMNTAVLVTCIRNFRRNRGPVSGILKGYVGLSTAIFTDICTALFAGDPSKFLFMLAVVPFAVCLTAVFFLREIPPANTTAEEKEETKYFNVFNAVAVVVAVYLLAYDFVKTVGDAVSVVFTVVLLVLLASPLLIPFYSYLKTQNSTRLKPDVEGQIVEPLLNLETTAVKTTVATAEDTAATTPEVAEEVKRRPVIGEDHTIFEAMRTVDFWILFLSFLCGVGTGMAVMNNMGQMGLALGYVDVSTFVSLTSIFGFFRTDYFGFGFGALPQESWNTKTSLECSFSDSNGCWLHAPGSSRTRFSLHRFDHSRVMLRSPSSCYRPSCLRTIWSQILRSNLQHFDPQPPSRFLPLLRPACRILVRC